MGDQSGGEGKVEPEAAHMVGKMYEVTDTGGLLDTIRGNLLGAVFSNAKPSSLQRIIIDCYEN